MPTPKESAQVIEEPEETQEDELEEASKPEDETSAESAEEETESEEEEEKEPEETIEEKIDRLAQSKKDKELKSVYKEMDGLKTRNAELEDQLSDKIWDRETQSLFNEDVENLGEEEAQRRKVQREQLKGEVKTFRTNARKVETTLTKIGDADMDAVLKDLEVPNLVEGINKLSFNARNQKAREEIWRLVFPEDKQKVERVTALVKKFEKAQDSEDFEIILEGIKESVKGKSFIPDSGTRESGRGEKLEGDDALARGLELERKRRR